MTARRDDGASRPRLPGQGLRPSFRQASQASPVLALARELHALGCIDPALLASLASFVVTAPAPLIGGRP